MQTDRSTIVVPVGGNEKGSAPVWSTSLNHTKVYEEVAQSAGLPHKGMIMKNVILATIAATSILAGTAMAQVATIPTGPAASNSGQNSADPMMVDGASTYGAVDVLGTPSLDEGITTNAIPTSPQAENGGQNSADPASSPAMGTTSGPELVMGGTESGSVPTSPAAENDGEQSADPAS